MFCLPRKVPIATSLRPSMSAASNRSPSETGPTANSGHSIQYTDEYGETATQRPFSTQLQELATAAIRIAQGVPELRTSIRELMISLALSESPETDIIVWMLLIFRFLSLNISTVKMALDLDNRSVIPPCLPEWKTNLESLAKGSRIFYGTKVVLHPRPLRGYGLELVMNEAEVNVELSQENLITAISSLIRSNLPVAPKFTVDSHPNSDDWLDSPPNIVIHSSNTTTPDPIGTFLFIQAVPPMTPSYDDPGIVETCLGFLHCMFQSQHRQIRSHFIGLLTTITVNVFFVYHESTHTINIYTANNLNHAIKHIMSIISDENYHPPVRVVPDNHGHMSRLLSRTPHSTVWEFKPTDKPLVVVKVLTDVHHTPRRDDEVSILRRISDTLPPNYNGLFPLLEQSSPTNNLFSYTPVGTPLSIPQRLSTMEMQLIYSDIATALEWFHTTHSLVHRDLRTANVIIHHTDTRKRGMLIDFGSVAQAGVTTLWQGGNVCRPLHVLLNRGNFDVPYEPQTSHDWEAFVCMAWELTMGLDDNNARESIARRVELAKDMEGPWGETLRKIVDGDCTDVIRVVEWIRGYE
ncbi:hypothetical protein BDD12DRAFT_808456 [Trichophaea hybrida]|nr:hypothetical protein BDD12DRAFT_808456 [Trichophaea hybrida]